MHLHIQREHTDRFMYKTIISILFGIAGYLCGLIFETFGLDAFGTGVTIGMLFPLLVSRCWGWFFGILAACIALILQTGFFLHIPAGYIDILIAILLIAWIFWHGIWAKKHQRTGMLLCNPFIVELPFRLIFAGAVYGLVPLLHRLNPPAWSPESITAAPTTSFLHLFLLTRTINAYFALALTTLIMRTRTCQKIFRTAGINRSREGNWITGIAVCIGLGFWIVDAVLDFFIFRKDLSFTELLLTNIPPHDFYLRSSFLLACMLSGMILAEIFSRMLNQEKQFLAKLSTFQVITENTTDILIILDRTYRLQYATPSIHLTTGYTSGELIHTHLEQCIHPSDYPRIKKILDSASRNEGRTVLLNYFRMASKDSTETRWLEGKCLSMLDDPTVRGIVMTCRDVTIRKHAEDELSQSEERYRTIMENLSEGIWMIDTEGNTTYVNAPMATILGYTPQEMEGRHLFDFIKADDIATCTEYLSRRKKGIRETHDFAFIRKDGTTVSTRVASNPMFDDQGRYIGAVAGISDRTQWQQSEQKIQSLARFPDENPYPVIRLDDRGTVLYANKAASCVTETWGTSVGEQLPPSWIILVGETLRSNAIKRVELKTESGYFLLHFTPITSEGYVNVYGFDITDRNKTRDALEQSERKYRELFTNSRDGLVFCDIDGNFMQANTAFEQMIGYTTEELLQLNYEDITPKKWRHIERNIMHNQLLKRGFTDLYTKEYIRKDGTIFPVEIQGYLTYDKESAPNGSWALIRDITERQKAQFDLADSERKYRELFDNIRDGMVIADLDGTILHCNAEYTRMLGYSLEELQQLQYPKITPAKWHAKEQKIIRDQVLTRGYSDIYEKEYIKKDGTVFPIELSVYLIRDTDNNPVGMWGIARDITERKRASQQRERLLQTLETKNDELESIVYVSSHDLRSPLVNINGFTTEIGKSIDKIEQILNTVTVSESIRAQLDYLLGKDIPPALEYIHTSAEKMDTLLVGLTRLSRLGQTELDIKLIDMNHLIAGIVESFSRNIQRLGARISVEPLPVCYGDALQIHQAFNNVIDNALAYNAPGRKLNITISGSVQGKFAVYKIRDNGIGIRDEHQKKIFEVFHRLDPYHRTNGQGLGLTIVRRIVAKHGGKVWVESQPDRGSTFFISLRNKPF